MSNGLTFTTYEERYSGSTEDRKWVDFERVGGLEEGRTSFTLSGICDLATLYVEQKGHLKSAAAEGHHYTHAPRVQAGISDIAARPWSDPDSRTKASQVSKATVLVLEKKFKITMRDWLVLAYVLRRHALEICVDEKGSVTLVAGDFTKHMSAALRLVLAQVSPS